MTKWTIPDASTFHRGDRCFGSGFDMMRRIEALEAETARLMAAHLTIIQSAPTLQYAIQTSRDALYPKEAGA